MMEKLQYNIEGMTCAACVSAVEKAVGKVEGVDSVEVNLLTKSMNVNIDDTMGNISAISEAVDKAGYKASLKASKESGKASVSENRDIYKEELDDKSFRLKISALFLVPLMYIAMGEMYGLPLPEIFKGHDNSLFNIFTQFLLTLPILFVNFSYFERGFKSLFNKVPNMDSLIAIGSGASVLYGVFVIYKLIEGFKTGNHDLIMQYGHEVYFESAATILTLITLGKYFEAKSKRRTSNAISKLLDLAPKKAIIIRDGIEVEVDVAEIKIDDIVVVKPGERIAADGVVVEGSTTVDQSILTGESIPVEKEIGSDVYTATINKNGNIKLRVTKSQEDSTLSQIVNLVEEASATKAPIAKMADKISGIFVPVVIVIAIIATIYWVTVGAGFEFAFSMGVAILVISCPCALGLATPVAIMVGTGKGASSGVLIKSAESLEGLHAIDTIVLDKTGTITLGKPFVTDIVTGAIDKDELINIANALESKSEHPLAEAIMEYTKGKNTKNYETTNFNAIPGIGLEAEIEGKKYFAGNSKILDKLNITSQVAIDEASRLAAEGKTPMYFTDETEILGIIAAADVVKPTSKDAIKRLKDLGLDVIMLTGDNKITAKSIADEIGISNVISDVLPDSKESAIREVQASGKKVAMVGDGINDAPALARADIGIAIGAGTDIAIESADIVLMKNNILDVVNAINLSKQTIRNIKQNLFWAFFYNTLGIPVAAGIFYNSFGLKLSPMIAAGAMSISSLFVVGNALRLNTFKPIETSSIVSNEQDEIEVNITKLDINDYKNLEDKSMEKKINISGMTCGHCSARVEKALNEIEGVEASVDLENAFATVKSNHIISDDVIKHVVEEAGYTVESIE